ncbi:hypothetical protein H6G33_09395 [Calothrix sp. FACHB-1219]|uniref:hypothetical protein n=1 Tax=unclassified Calothrix TaxID=2619626 RepID=UPI001681E6A5|nr:MULTISPECIES: hypothetical protein [unclassified Calothrix]MBD2201560.1 hypothetical protein [Calothrix sp. FACHB-168]MBD2217246.1 hypothetical protein [Calothrix sp. FACHB-1219]
MLKLINSILSENPTADITLINKLQLLVDKYNLKWVPSKLGKGAYFIMHTLSTSKELSYENYRRNWSKSNKLQGKGMLLKGDNLKSFKKIYKDIHKVNLGANLNSLWIGDWLHAYDYLTKIVNNAAGKTSKVQKPKLKLVNGGKTSWASEFDIQEELVKLASYSNLNLRREYVIDNLLKNKTNNLARTRRYDLVHISDKRVVIYELKKGLLTIEDVSTSLGEKGYMNLARSHFGKEVKLVFLSPIGIQEEAKRLIDEMSNIGFLKVNDFAKAIYLSIEEEMKKKDSLWFARERILPQFPRLLKELIVKREAA